MDRFAQLWADIIKLWTKYGASYFTGMGNTLALAGLIVFGLGCAPVYPSIIHATPRQFGAENSQAIIGIQMASAYTGSTLMPPLFGFIAAHVSVSLYPLFLLLLTGLLLIMTQRLNRLHPVSG